MTISNTILNSKLCFSGSADTIIRERLQPLLARILENRLTTVIAGAGYGKSTLVFQAAKSLGTKTVWYRLDKYDKELSTFLGYLISAVQKYFPEAGKDTLLRIQEAPILENERASTMMLFLNELEQIITEDILIVLDDYHNIDDSSAIREALSVFLENLPPQVHLVLTSRSSPSQHLSLFRSRRQVLDIDETDLAFTTSEIDQLYTEIFGLSLEKESLIILHEKTGGWVPALILFYHTLDNKGESEIEDLLMQLKGSHKTISRYLEENVYNMQTDQIKSFLRITSLLSQIDASLCNSLLQTTKSHAILKYLEDNHLFTFSINEDRDVFCFHTLFRDFLQMKLRQDLSDDGISKLHCDIAVLMEKKGEKEAALNHYLKAQQIKNACNIICTIGNTLMDEGRVHRLQFYIDEIPHDYLHSEPRIQYLQARIYSISNDTINAIQHFNIALKLFKKRKYLKEANLCRKELGRHYNLCGDLVKAEKIFRGLLKPANNDILFNIEVLGHLITISAFLGDMKTADLYYDQCVSLLAELPESQAIHIRHAWLNFVRCLRYLYSGDYFRALSLCEKSKKHPNATYLISLTHCFLGNYSKGLEEAEQGLRLMKQRGFQNAFYALLLLSAGMNHLGMGKTTHAQNTLNNGLEIFQKAGNHWGMAQFHIMLCICNMITGNLSKAQEHIKLVYEESEVPTPPYIEGQLKLSEIFFCLEKGEVEKAMPLFKDVEKISKPYQLISTRLSCAHVRLAWIKNKKQLALDKLLSCLKFIEANNYTFLLVWESYWIIPLLVELFARDKMKTYIQSTFELPGLLSADALSRLKKSKNPGIKKSASYLSTIVPKAPPPSLKIYCLGQFILIQGDNVIYADSWKSKKALKLFKFLVFAKDKGFLPKEMLMELLWPEADPEKARNRLYVTVNSLKKTLEPNLSKGTTSSYLLSEKNAYKLSMSAIESVDIDDFKKASTLGVREKDINQAMIYFKTAEKIYKGDFLDEDPYEEWCLDEREKLKAQYLQVLVYLMDYFENIRDYSVCIEYAIKYIEKDKYAESIYQRLMNYYAKTHNQQMVSKTFEKCRNAITEELDSPLSRKTVTLYQNLTLDVQVFR